MRFNHVWVRVCLLLLIALAGWACTEVPATNPFDPEAPMELQRKVTLSGVVLDADSREVIVGAVVTLTGPTNPDNNPYTTLLDDNVDDGSNESGSYRFEGLLPGRYRLEVVHAGHIKQIIELGKLEAGENIEQEVLMVSLPAAGDMVELPPEVGRISGVAYKEGQLAIEDASLRDHSGITVEIEGTGVRTVTNQAGDFDLFLNAGTYSLILTAPNYTRHESEPIELAESEERRLEAPITLQSDPGVVAGTVLLEGVAAGGHGDITVTLANTSLTAQTNDDGDFRLDDVPAGIYTLRASRDGFDTQTVSGVVVASHPDTIVDAVALPMSRGSVEGTINLVNSNSNGGVAIELLNTSYGTFSNAAGSFRVDGIPVGEYTVRACTQGYEPLESPISVLASETIQVPNDGATIELARQQFAISAGGEPLLATSSDYTLTFAQVPAWVTGVKVTGDLAPVESVDFRQYDAQAGSVALRLSESDGSKVLNIQFRGDGCYLSDVFQAVVTLDTTAPIVVGLSFQDVVSTATGVLTNSTDATLLMQAVGANELRITGPGVSTVGGLPNEGAWFAAPEGAQVSIALGLDGATDGEKSVTVEARDLAGNLAPAQTITVQLDREAPQNGSITINDGQPITQADGQVSLSLSATGANEYQLSNSDAFGDALWESYVTSDLTHVVDRPIFDGVKTIYARFRDAAGNVSELVSTQVTLDRKGFIQGTVALEGGDGVLTDVQILLDGDVVGNARANGSFILPSVDVGNREVSVALTDYTVVETIDVDVGPESSSPDNPALVLRHDFGTISGTVQVIGPTAVTEVAILLNGENVGSPNEDGSFTIRAPITIEPARHSLEVLLTDHTSRNGAADFAVYPLETVPANHVFVLEYDTGSVSGTIDLADTDGCGGAEVLIDNVSQPTSWEGCTFTVERVNVGDRNVKVTRALFESANQGAMVRSNETTGLVEVFELERSTGSAAGYVELQSQNTHGGIQVIFNNVTAPVGSETPRSYTTLTFDSGRFEQVDMWEGNYEVYAQIEGYVRSYLGEVTVNRNAETLVTTEDDPEILARQVGDFLINDGAAYSRVDQAALSLGFAQIQAFRVRVNADTFDDTACAQDADCGDGRGCYEGECWIKWNDPNSDGLMIYGSQAILGAGGSDSIGLDIEIDGAVPLGGGDGEKIIEIQTRDLTNINSSEPFYRASIVLDTIPPALPAAAGDPVPCAGDGDCNGDDICVDAACTPPAVLIDDGNAYTNSSLGLVQLTLAATDANGIAAVRRSNAVDCGQEGLENSDAFVAIMNHTLSAPDDDGDKGVFVCFLDPAGNVSPVASASINLDRVKPQIETFGLVDYAGDHCLRDEAECLVNDRLVELKFTESIGGDTAEVAVAMDDPTFAGASWQSPSTNGDGSRSIFFTLPNEDGAYTLYLKARDLATNVLGSAADDTISVNLDLDSTAPPRPTATAPEYVREQQVSVDFTNLDGVDIIEASWDPDFEVTTTHAPNATVAFDLPSNDEATYTLRLRYLDAVNNTSLVKSLSVTYDVTAPQISRPTINYGNEYLQTPDTVVLEIPCSDGPIDANLLTLNVNHADGASLFDGPFVQLITVDVPNAQGASSVDITCQDPAGNVSQIQSVQYTLDSLRPRTGLGGSAVVINDADDTHANSQNVRLGITAVDESEPNAEGSGITDMAISNVGLDCDTANYEAIRDEVQWVLPAGDVEHTVTVCLRDMAGNTASVSDSVILDTQAPAGSLTINNGPVSPSRTIQVTAGRTDDDASLMALAEGYLDCGAQATVYVPFSTDAQEVEVDGEGTYDISLCLSDTAGNRTKYEESVRVDLTPPTGFIQINGGAAYTTSNEVIVNLTSSPDVADLKLSEQNNVDCADDNGYAAVDLASTFDFVGVDGRKQLSGCVRDEAGHTYELDVVEITLDTTAPTGLRLGESAVGILLNEGAQLTNLTTVSAALKGTDATSGIADFKLSSGDGCNGGAWQPWSPDGETQTIAQQIEEGDNVARDVSVRFRDAAGNESDLCYSDSITVDTIPLAVTNFVASATADGNTELTTNKTIDVTINYNGTGTCDHYEVSENAAFVNAETTRFEACGENGGAFTLSEGDEVKVIYARVVDTAGNSSDPLSTQIELDTEDPTLTGLTLVPSAGANGDFTDRRDVQLRLTGVSGGTRVQYRLYDTDRDCPAFANLNTDVELAVEFTVSFGSDGPKTACAAVVDDAGNHSEVQKATIHVDTESPSAPALDPNNLSGINSSCANITPSGDLDDNFWKFEYRQLGATWTESLTDVDVPITIALHQDSDNIIEVRAIDSAGNRGEVGQAFVEEASSVLIPTNLQIKQICNGGEYAILKDMSVKRIAYTDKENNESDVTFVQIPAVALLNLSTYEIRSFNPTITRDTITQAACNAQAVTQLVVDAACTIESPRLLVVSPIAAFGACAAVPVAGTPLRGRSSLWVYPDPIGSPLAQGEEITETLQGVQDEDGDGLAITSIDVLDWTDTDYDFRAVVGSAHTTAPPHIALPDRLRHVLRRMEGDSSDDETTVSPEIDGVSYSITFDSADARHIRGLGLYGDDRTPYIRWDGVAGHWQLWYSDICDGNCFSGSNPTATWTSGNDDALTHLDTFTEQNTDANVSPYNVTVGPALYPHRDAEVESRQNFTYLDSGGIVRAKKSNNSSRATLATGGPSNAPYFEAGEDVANYVDAGNAREFYFGDEYGDEATAQRYRYPVDVGQGVFPYMTGGGVGEPYVVYHTSGITRGIVVGFKNDAGCAE